MDHSLQFADYLFKTEQFDLASEEYERIVFLKPDNQQNKIKLIQSYRFSKKYDLALKKIEYFFGEKPTNIPVDFAEEYVKLLLITNKNEDAYNFLEINNSINPQKRQNYQLSSLLLQKKWDKAFVYALKNPVINNDKNNAELHLLAFKTKEVKYKKPFNAALFSALIPGSGKIYTKRWKDAVISFLFVGLNSWQSYRGFNKNGSESVYGWVFAGFASGFYVGNIYGSYKSAKKYNKEIDDEIYFKTAELTVNSF
ncbi:MAG: hypothetical protein JXR51_06800 [Bacteroidales bacterium]|nr:hypothetical protein [Bacteroidales bacterium]